MVTGAPVWNAGSGSPQRAGSKTDFDHRELGIMSVNSRKRFSNFLGSVPEYIKTTAHIEGSVKNAYLDSKSVWTGLC